MAGRNINQINITLQISSTFMQGANNVVRNGWENVNPNTGRVDVNFPNNLKQFTNSNTQLQNVQSQFREFRNTLQNLLGVPVNLNFQYNTLGAGYRLSIIPK